MADPHGPTQPLPVLTPLERYRQQYQEAIRRTDAAVARWRKRKAFAEQYTERLDEFNRRRWYQNDAELADAMSDYGFWQREVVRLAAQLQTLFMLSDWDEPRSGRLRR